MKSVDLHNVEYGECVVLNGHNGGILMVDCGSSNQKIRERDVPFTAYVNPTLLELYGNCPERSFLLTHFHRDHLCGLMQILSARPGWFQRIFLPAQPCDRYGSPLLLEFALFVYSFLGRQTDYAIVNVSSLKILERAVQLTPAAQVVPVGQGDCFGFDGVAYDVLWPPRRDCVFSDLFAGAVEEMNVCLSSPFLPECARQFLALKNAFCQAYLACCAGGPLDALRVAECSRLLAEIDALLPAVNLLPSAPDIQEILNRPVTKAAYTEELNAASVVFHNRRTQEASTDDILMTGDASPETLDALAELLYENYYIIKAPHHGTASHWSHLLSEISSSHILVSNGDYQQAGKIAPAYLELPAVKHCTNCSACDWYAVSGCSCNRMAVCYDLANGAGLTIKCPYVCGAQQSPDCGIFIVGAAGRRSCLCDNLPVQIN